MPDDTPTPRRKPIPKRVRFEVLKRDGHRCRYCGATAEDAKLTVDHVVPVVLGGSDDPTNLATACAPCNSGKTSTNPDDELVQEVDEAAHAMADAFRLVMMQRRERQAEIDEDVDYFGSAIWGRFTYGNGNKVELPSDWRITVERFLGLGFDLKDLRRFTEIAMGSKATGAGVFAYFCGVAWNTLRDVQTKAAEMVGIEAEIILAEEEIL